MKGPGEEHTVERHIVEWYRYCGRIHGGVSLGRGYTVERHLQYVIQGYQVKGQIVFGPQVVRLSIGTWRRPVAH